MNARKLILLTAIAVSIILSAASAGVADDAKRRLVLLPDLVITKMYLDRHCTLLVDMKNQGGPIGTKPFRSAKIHISAGPSTVLPAGKSTLKTADPTGRLKGAGGTVTFNTGLKVKGTELGMGWLDTGHHIKESNEQNNGGNGNLVCKK